MKINPAIKEAIKNDNLVIFAGSGLSLKFNLPNWQNLVMDIITKIDDEKYNTLIPVIEKELIPPIDALEILKPKHNEIKRYIFDKFKIKDSDYSLHKNIIELSGQIITTNFDNAFEEASNYKINPAIYTSEFNINEINKRNKKYIFKLHGSYTEPDHCIIFKEQYEELYTKETAAKEKLKSIFSEKVLLFLGFSFNDPDINLIFNNLDKAFKNHNKHFVLTPEPKDFEKFNFIESIKISDFSEISTFVEECLKYKNETKKTEININTKLEVIPKELSSTETKEIELNILYPNPVDKDLYFKKEIFHKLFEKYKVTLKIRPFNIANLRDVENGYLFIFTKTVKENILIEDEYLKSKQISISDLSKDVNDNIDGVFVFCDDSPKTDDFSSSIPLAIIVEKDKYKFNSRIENFNHLFFTKNKFESNDIVLNSANFKFHKKIKGTCKLDIYRPIISNNIDQKILSHFIGRKTDVENIVRKFIDLEIEKEILTIKGAGGIGKTTIICKVALELANRNIFNKINFISCQGISSYENFEYQISKCFSLESSVELEEQIVNQFNGKKSVLILDNFETVLNIKESDKVIKLISFLCEYSLVVVTSRQLLNLDFEHPYELRNMTSEEGTFLFKEFFKKKLSESEEMFLRNEIVDVLLNNNPLAIKLIAKGTLPSKDLHQLKKELKEDIFNGEDIHKIFENPEDINIEKSKSLYYSIKYSYDKLNEKEKLAFEILSLFPDGIHHENLKQFSKNKSSKSPIGNIEIKSLYDKSLLDDTNGFLKLQSIINKFSDSQFKKRDLKIRKEYHTECYNFNSFFNRLYNDERYFQSGTSLRLHDGNTNNYLKCIEFLDLVDEKKEVLLEFVARLSKVFLQTNQTKDFIMGLEKKKEFFKELNIGELAIDLIITNILYYTKEFDQAYVNLKNLIDIKELFNFLPDKSEINYNRNKLIIFSKAFAIYDCEGYSLTSLKNIIEKHYVEYSIATLLFKVGFVKMSNELSKMDKLQEFFDYEIRLANKLLKKKDIDNYINQLYKKDALEIVQANYTRLKLSKEEQLIDTKKFIITNPYTKGLINLINAIQENDHDKKVSFFKESLRYLKHIKYYYLEALLFYSKYLNERNLNSGKDLIAEGLRLSRQHNFMYLNHLFERELNPNIADFDENKLFSVFEIDENNFKEYLKNYKKRRGK